MAHPTIANSTAELAAARRELADKLQKAAARDERLEWQLDMTYQWISGPARTPQVDQSAVRSWIPVEEAAARAARDAYDLARAALARFDAAHPDLRDEAGHG
jgi:hypothetical protein